jgi:hypothetical protein
MNSIMLCGLLCLSGIALASNGGDSLERQFQQPNNSCAIMGSTLLDIVSEERVGRSIQVPIWQLSGNQALFFVSGMTIDADGAPNAYHPNDTGLDELANAGTPERWDGIVTDREGTPLIQEERDPFPGYYISCTSLEDDTKAFTDPSRYVDASTIPYVVLPGEVAKRAGMQLGDFAAITNLRNGKLSFAIYADMGTLGEGSIALADALEINSDARRGGAPAGILYVLFPGAGNFQPRSNNEIQREGQRLLSTSNVMNKVSSCVD